MFTPKFTESEHIGYNLEEISRLRYRIERMLIMPKHELWLRREAFVRTSYSSTMIEDSSIPEHEVEEAARPSPLASIPKERPDIVNYGRALEFVDFLSDAKMELESGELVIRIIHRLLMGGIDDTRLRPGEYNTEPNWVEDRGVRVYETAFHVDVPILMRELSDWLKEDIELNPVLKAGIGCLHLIAIHPFVDGNGRTARLLATLLLQQHVQQHDYGFRKLLSLDAYFQRHRDEYIQALRQSLGPSFNKDYDATPWLEFFTLSLLLQASALESRLTDWRIRVEQIHRGLAPLGFSDRQIDGLIYASKVGHVTRKDYMEVTGVSPLTATRDLQQIAKKGVLVPEGAGRNRRYKFRAPEAQQDKEEQQRRLL
jgi:Fic family protein